LADASDSCGHDGSPLVAERSKCSVDRGHELSAVRRRRRPHVAGGLGLLPERLATDHDVDTLVNAVCDVPVGPSDEGRSREWATALLQVIEELGLGERDRLLDALGGAADRETLVRSIGAWRPWMNGYLVTDFLLRLSVPDYFDRRMEARPTRTPGAREAFTQDLASFRSYVAASAERN